MSTLSAPYSDARAESRDQARAVAIVLSQTLRSLGRTDEAREAGREGIRRAEHILVLNPRDGRALSLGSGVLFEDGPVARAKEWSRQSLALDPDDVCALVNGACPPRPVTATKRWQCSSASSRAAWGSVTG